MKSYDLISLEQAASISLEPTPHEKPSLTYI